jgi:hypothetical protein
MSQQLITDTEIGLIFAPMRHEFHCNVLFCGYISECPEQAVEHVADEHGVLTDALNDLRSGEREMIYTYSNEALRTIERDVIGEIDYPF